MTVKSFTKAQFESFAKTTGNDDWRDIKYMATQPDGTSCLFYRKPYIVDGQWMEAFSGSLPIRKDPLGGMGWEHSLIKKPLIGSRNSRTKNISCALRRPVSKDATEARITREGFYQEKINFDSSELWRCDCGAVSCSHGRTFYQRHSWVIDFILWIAAVVAASTAMLSAIKI